MSSRRRRAPGAVPAPGDARHVEAFLEMLAAAVWVIRAVGPVAMALALEAVLAREI